MREIQFRAKALKEKRWVYGDLLHAGTDPSDGEWEIMYWDDESGWMQERVDPATIGQFTGCLDKYGNRVWEGDIVDAWSAGSHTDHGLIKCDAVGGFFILLSGERGPQGHWNLAPSQYDRKDESLLVVGNRYDSPERVRGYIEWEKQQNKGEPQ